MENYPPYSYPDSGNSSPRSRETDFENRPSWEDQPPPSHLNYKIKFMVSYGGKIQPRSHDNLLSYVGGETKILSLDPNIKFSTLFAKLCSIISPDSDVVSGFTFKYQLPGEELDALISVTNDDDLENMMHEYDRLIRGSSKPARLRLFLFPLTKSGSFGSCSSDPGKIDRDSDRFVDALNSGPPPPQPQPQPQPPPQVIAQPLPVNNNVDYLFGLEKQQHPHHPHPVQIPVQVPDPQIDSRIQELNRMQISAPKNERDPNMFAGPQANIPASVQVPAQYWQPPPPAQPVNVEQQPPQQQPPPQHHPHHHQQFHHQSPPPSQHQHHQPPQNQHQQLQQHQQQPQHLQQQPVYMMHAGPPPQENMMHAPPQMMRPPPSNQGYYQVQRVPDQAQQQQQPVYNMNTGKMGGYSEGMGVPARSVPGMAPESQGYAQVAYDSGSGRQVYYAAQQQGGGAVPTSYQGVPVSGDMRTMAAEAKVVHKGGPTSNAAV